MADSFNDTPSEGDGFTYEHYAERKEVWIDFMADTGDGGNPTYAVARGLAAPTLVAAVSEGVKLSPGEAAGLTPGAAADQGAGGNAAQKCVNASTGAQSAATPGFVELPRADVLLLGGDLAYPNPSRETFEQRLFVPFQDAFPPPPHYHPGNDSNAHCWLLTPLAHDMDFLPAVHCYTVCLCMLLLLAPCKPLVNTLAKVLQKHQEKQANWLQ